MKKKAWRENRFQISSRSEIRGLKKKKKGLEKSIIAQLELEDYLGSKSRHRHLLLRTAYQLPIDSSIDPIFNLRPAEKTRSHPR